jgi:uncharacterized protein YutD
MLKTKAIFKPSYLTSYLAETCSFGCCFFTFFGSIRPFLFIQKKVLLSTSSLTPAGPG